MAALGESCAVAAGPMTFRPLASGAGWQVTDVLCRAGPRDPAAEEAHGLICLALVLGGTFHYRTSAGAATLAPGAVLLGDDGAEFTCRHEHSIGDRCLAFHLTPDWYDDALTDMPRSKRQAFDRPALPPDPARSVLLVAAEAILDDPSALEEVAHDLAAHVAGRLADGTRAAYRSSGNRRRIEEIAHLIESDPTLPYPLAELAGLAGMSPCYFLRTFRHELGITPHQFVLDLRLRRAARRLREESETVLDIALDCGFGDLSEFTRRFTRLIGRSPAAFRQAQAHTISSSRTVRSSAAERRAASEKRSTSTP